MPVYKDKKHGTWFARFRYKDYTGNLRQTTKRGFKTKKEAQEYERAELAAVGRPSDISFDKFCDEYLSDCRARIKESSCITIAYWIEHYIRPAFRKRKLTEIMPADIRKWENDLLHHIGRNGKTLSSSTLSNISSRLSVMLDYAVKYYGLPKNPMLAVSSIGKQTKRYAFWTLDEFTAFLQQFAPRDAYYKLIFEILFFSGMRIGELNALTLADLDFTRNEIRINKTYSQLTRKSSTPKTSASIRVVPMPSTLMQRVRAYIESLDAIPERLFAPAASTLNAKIRRYASLAGIPPINLHGFRHSHASYLLHAGVPVTTISERLGHASPDTTLRIYSHTYKNNEQDVVNLLETFFV